MQLLWVLGRSASKAQIILRAMAVSTLMSACVPPLDHKPLSVEKYEETSLREVFVERFWGDQAPPDLEQALKARLPVLRERLPVAVKADPQNAPFSRLLAISGGGADGAFGAGILAGWTESGERVEFDVVTCVSTGAIIAPFAFLGPDYEDTIVEIYASGNPDQVFEIALFSGLLLGSAAADTTPLKQQIEKHMAPELVEKIAC